MDFNGKFYKSFVDEEDKLYTERMDQSKPESNRLIDIIDDKEKVDEMNDDYHYRQNILPKINKLSKRIWNDQESTTDEEEIKDLEFVKALRDDLRHDPHHRITPLEMKKCNELWKKHK